MDAGKEERYMIRALELARRGEGGVNPNPLVGALIVSAGRIVGEGYHREFGGPHAEVYALEAAGDRTDGADLYVTLEPCAHYGRTPPCVDRIITGGINRVIIAMEDPYPEVSGRGIQRLRDAGIEVEAGILESEARQVNEIYLKYVTTGVPFVLLKMAMTADGKIATRTGDSRWISSKASRRRVHELRNRFSAILVGINTVLADDPELTVRLVPGRDPVRIVLASNGAIPLEAKLLNLESRAKTIVATTGAISRQKRMALEERGAEVWTLDAGEDGRVDPRALIAKLGEAKIDSLLIEGGSAVAASFIEASLVDKLLLFIAPKIVGGIQALTPVGGTGREWIEAAAQLRDVSVEMVDGDVAYVGYLSEGEEAE
ncbi:MAG: bifunctional diaminohydroxyphosphoribosylaminopyrimidine deaminase/5-amino-6-(5-phosphoribosylamino)uracil reductase RibD [Candidatus Bipolaricaulia bacterium]